MPWGFNPRRLRQSHFWGPALVPMVHFPRALTFTTSAGQLLVTITNTLAPSQIISSGQAVSDLSFTLSTAPGTLGNTRATGQLANFTCDNQAGCSTITNVSGTPTRFLTSPHFSISGNTITLEAIGGGQPTR